MCGEGRFFLILFVLIFPYILYFEVQLSSWTIVFLLYTSADYVFHSITLFGYGTYGVEISKFKKKKYYFFAALPDGSHEFFQILSWVMLEGENLNIV
jgi:hypothetical protein